MEQNAVNGNSSVTLATNSKVLAQNCPYTLFAAEVKGIPIDVVINNYRDRYLIVITQFKKFGTLVSVEKDTAHSEGEAKVVYSTNVLLGSDDDTVHAAARFLVEQLGLDKPVLISFGLKDLSPQVLKDLATILREHL